MPTTSTTVSLGVHVASVLSKARSLPTGADRNELRQQAIALRWLEQHGSNAAKDRAAELYTNPNRVEQQGGQLMCGTSDHQIEKEVARRYLIKIDEALGKLTTDEVRQVILEIEAQVPSPIEPAGSMADSLQ